MNARWIIAMVVLHGGASRADNCEVAGAGAKQITITVSERPEARIFVDLSTPDGRSIAMTFDDSSNVVLQRKVLLPPGKWFVSASGERTAIATQDGRGVVFFRYFVDWTSCGSTTKGTATLKSLSIGASDASWDEVGDSPKIMITVSDPAGARALDDALKHTAGDASLLQTTAGMSPARGFDSAVPDAVRDTLSLLAEIAIDRAKSEAASVLKAKIEEYLCGTLTIGKVFGSTGADVNERLLPALCGQLENLRISDLGASASGVVDALREDLVDVVVPQLLQKLPSCCTQRIKDSVQPLVPLLQLAVRRGFRADTVRLAVLDLLKQDDAHVPKELKDAIRVATNCVSQKCSLADIQALLDTLSPSPTFKNLSAFAVRLVAILQTRADEDPGKLAGELADLILDLAAQQCGSDVKCAPTVNALRDIVTGLFESNYLRALGGVTALLKAIGRDDALRGKPFALVASVASYIETYRDTQSKDPQVAHDLRKQALEGLIDASTDRSNRDGDWILSLGASVGFTGGMQYYEHSVNGIDSSQGLHDLRLPVGLTVQHLPGPDDNGWNPLSRLFVAFTVADIAQFANSPPTGDMTTAQPKTRWSDFVAPEVQLGMRFGNARVPFVVSIDAYFVPRVTIDTGSMTSTTSMLKLGLFAGFNVPFFDLN